ncbi:MAG: hypothetical protein ACOYT4_04935 [Nanoarchaeota archaeon]
MKKSWTIIILLLILTSAFVSAQVMDKSEESGNAKQEVNNILNEEIVIMQPFASLLSINEKVTLQYLIVLIGAWLMVFIVILDVMKLIPIFKSKAIEFSASLIVTFLISFTGTLNILINFFLSIAGFFELSKKYQIIKVIVAFLIAGALTWLGKSMVGILNRRRMLGKAEQIGENLAQGQKVAQAFKDAGEDLSKDKRNL